MNDERLDALLGEWAPPPLPDGLAERVAAAATALPQETHASQARRAAAPRRDRRGGWLRRSLIGGGVALGLAFSGAVAATLAGVPLPEKVEAVLAELPFVGRKEPPPAPKAVPRPAPQRAQAPPPAPVQEAAPDPEQERRARIVRRAVVAREIVRERRALGLPTPVADRIERRRAIRRQMIRREMARRWQEATPEEREQMREAIRARIDEQQARRARWREEAANEGFAEEPR